MTEESGTQLIRYICIHPQPFRASFGQNIKALRTEKDIPQDTFAKLIKVHPKHLSHTNVMWLSPPLKLHNALPKPLK